jgi:hypothetical protein
METKSECYRIYEVRVAEAKRKYQEALEQAENNELKAMGDALRILNKELADAKAECIRNGGKFIAAVT